MNKYIFTFLGLLLSISLSAALLLQINTLSAVYQGMDVRLDWQVDNDADVTTFELYRRKGDEPSFVRIATVTPNGAGNYSYTDSNIYKSVQSGSAGELWYELVAKGTSGSSKKTVQTSNSPTAVQASWGSIKSMFK